jgi:Mg2+/Co2+ transporter CorB
LDDIPLSLLFAALAFLLVLSAFFSGSETALMTLNRYRLRHMAQQGVPAAVRAQRLLERPDRLIGLILLGNNFVNILASSLATLIALRLGGEGAIAIAAGLLTLVMLIFSEVAPKTLAALHPERIAFPSATLYAPLLHPWMPTRWLVWLVTHLVNGLLRMLRLSPEDAGGGDRLTQEELRTVLNEAGALIPRPHRRMLLNILDLERARVEDIMIPRNEIDGIDLDAPFDELLQDLARMPYTSALAYRGGMDRVVGVLHSRDLVRALIDAEFDRAELESLVQPPYYIPEGTPLNLQLANFQRERRRSGLVVDEYGDILGMITLIDLLEEIVGQFSSDPADRIASVQPQDDGSYLVDGAANVRDLVRSQRWALPTTGPRTLNGLILEHLEAVPDPGTSLMIAGYPIEVLQVQDNMVKVARVAPALRRVPAEESGRD